MNTKLLISTNNDAKNTKCRKLNVIPIPKLNGNLNNLFLGLIIFISRLVQIVRGIKNIQNVL